MVKKAAIKNRDEQELIDKAIRDAKFRKQQANTVVDPEKDDFRKSIADKQARADADADDDAPLMQEFYRGQDDRNDFKKWKESHSKDDDEFKAWKDRNLPSEKMEQIDDSKLTQVLQDVISGGKAK